MTEWPPDYIDSDENSSGSSSDDLNANRILEAISAYTLPQDRLKDGNNRVTTSPGVIRIKLFYSLPTLGGNKLERSSRASLSNLIKHVPLRQGACPRGKLGQAPALLANIRLGLSGTDALAY